MIHGEQGNIVALAITFVLAAIITISLVVLLGREEEQVTVTNFKECVAAGYPVMESYPEQCSDGENTFVNTLP